MAIFPNSCVDVDSIIISYFDNPVDAIHLCQVNTTANQSITDAVFFRSYYRKNYLYYECDNFFFTDLRILFPEISWKVACCALSKGIVPNAAFIKMSIPKLPDQLSAYKDSLESEKKIIFGSYFGDPAGKLNQAWKAAESAKAAFKIYTGQLKQLERGEECPELAEFASAYKELSQLYTNGQMNNRVFSCACKALLKDSSDLVDEEKKYLTALFDRVNNSEEEFGYRFHQNLIAQYKAWGKVLSHGDALNCEDSSKLEEYTKLEGRRTEVEKRINKVNEFFERINCSISQLDTEKLSVHFYEIFVLEKNRAIYVECHRIIAANVKGYRSGEDETPHPNSLDPIIVERIYRLVNAHSQSEEIFGSLYEKYAKDVNEAQWSENHFHEFLPGLVGIMQPLNKFPMIMLN